MNAGTVPATMRAVRLNEVGPPENLKVVDIRVPEVGPDDVLIKTSLSGLLYADTAIRRGIYFTPTQLPYVPGRDVAGTVAAVGANVTDYSVGDRVMALIVEGGCCAEYVLASCCPTLRDGQEIFPADIVKLPHETAFADALPYLINFRLAHLLFHSSSKVPDGSTVLIHGASGGMGSMLTQLARAAHCTIIATCRTESEEAFCHRLGADSVIRVGENDYVARVMELTSHKGVHFSFNGVGGESLNRDVDVVMPFGEIQAYGYVGGKTKFDTFRIAKSLALKTFAVEDFLGTPMMEAATAAMFDWLRNGVLIAADPILPFEKVAEAHQLLEEGTVFGKIALAP